MADTAYAADVGYAELASRSNAVFAKINIRTVCGIPTAALIVEAM